MPLFRFARRAAAWEGDRSADQIIQAEFRTREGEDDLRPSVYELTPGPELIRACAEHTSTLDAKRPTLALDCTTDRPTIPTPGTLPFELTRERHREIVLQDRADLAALVTTLSKERARHLSVTDAEVTTYVTSRVAANDPEWIAATSAAGAKKWVRKLRRPA